MFSVHLYSCFKKSKKNLCPFLRSHGQKPVFLFLKSILNVLIPPTKLFISHFHLMRRWTCARFLAYGIFRGMYGIFQGVYFGAYEKEIQYCRHKSNFKIPFLLGAAVSYYYYRLCTIGAVNRRPWTFWKNNASNRRIQLGHPLLFPLHPLRYRDIKNTHQIRKKIA